MCFVLGLLQGLVGTAFVVVPAMAILLVGVVVSTARATVILKSLSLSLSLDAHGRNQGHTQQEQAHAMMIKSLHVFLLERPSLILARFWTR